MMLKRFLTNCYITIGLLALLFIVSLFSDGYSKAVADMGTSLKEDWMYWVAIPFVLLVLRYFLILKRKAYNLGRYGNTGGKKKD